MERHDLIHEFPEHREKILTLQKQSNRFRKLFEDYKETDHQIYRIEEGMVVTTDERLNELRMKRVYLKDSVYRQLV
jgi:uncharacterized protein YdcH (DUF465 family)